MESPEHERRHTAEYVEVQAPGERVKRAEKIASERLLGQKYDVWDVETDKNQWWVVTNPTNLYRRDEFTSMDYVLSFHIGLAERVIARQARSARTGDEEKDRLRVAWRKWEQAAHACDEAEEAEEFQAVAMRCRESLLALIHAVSTDAMVPDGEQPPKRSDFVQWTGYIAAAVTPSAPRLRAYLRKVAAGAWDLVNWLTHAANADRVDATIAVDATAYTLDLFGVALLRHERGGPRRCPKCGSYRLATDWRFEDDVSVTLCKACEWRSEPHPKRRPAP